MVLAILAVDAFFSPASCHFVIGISNLSSVRGSLDVTLIDNTFSGSILRIITGLSFSLPVSSNGNSAKQISHWFKLLIVVVRHTPCNLHPM